MIILGIIITCIAGYFCLGYRSARRRLPLTWAKARKAWNFEDNQISDVKAITVFTAIVPVDVAERGEISA